MDIFLQVWGGLFYLTNKILFSLSEAKSQALKTKLKMYAWSAYIIGAPAWIFLLIEKNNWIAASVEAGGIPAMLLGLYKTFFHSTVSSSIESLVKYITYAAIVFGVGHSLMVYGGISTLSQVLELGVTVGFLLGTYLMTKHDERGYLFFMLMNLSMAALMGSQDKHILMTQQLMSLLFVVYGYSQSVKHKNQQNNQPIA